MFRRYRFNIMAAILFPALLIAIAQGAQAVTLQVGKPAILAEAVDIYQKAAQATGKDGMPLVAFYGEGDLHNTLQVARLKPSASMHEVYRLADGPNVVQGTALAASDGHYHLLWRPKLGTEKFLYYARSSDGKEFDKAILLNRDMNALLPFSIRTGAGGLVVAAWVDERSQVEGGGNPHHAYLAISTDGGKTFGEDINASAEYTGASHPVLLVKGATIRLFFVASRKNGSVWLVTRWSSDAGKSWQQTEIMQVKGRTAPVQVTPVQTAWTTEGASAARLLLFWGNGKKGLAEALSDDGGVTWQQVALPDEMTDEFELSVDVAVGRDGLIYLVDGVAFPQDPKKKANSFFHLSRDGGKSWENRQRISAEPYHLTMNLNPRVAVDDSGMVTVVWQDYRHIRSDIFLKASTDSGKTWTDDTLLEEDGKYTSLRPRLIARGAGSYDVLYLSLDNDLLESGGLRFTHVDLKP